MIKDKKILVIGGGGLLGSHVVERILLEGGSVIAVDKNLDSMQNSLKNLDINLDSIKLKMLAFDITNEMQTKDFFNEVKLLDGAVNCSYPRSKNYGAPFLDVSQNDFNLNLSLHLGSAFLLMRECTSYFQKTKLPFSLVNISSIYGTNAPDFSIYEGTGINMPIEYAAIKSAIIHMNKYVAKFVSNSSFRVNSVSPGGLFDDQPKEFVESYRKKTLGTGMIHPSDITGAIIFLLSNNAKYINGQNIIVDDGFSI